MEIEGGPNHSDFHIFFRNLKRSRYVDYWLGIPARVCLNPKGYQTLSECWSFLFTEIEVRGFALSPGAAKLKQPKCQTTRRTGLREHVSNQRKSFSHSIEDAIGGQPRFILRSI